MPWSVSTRTAIAGFVVNEFHLGGATTVISFGDRGPSLRELLRKNCTDSLTTPEEKNSGIDAERSKI
jgi:hypothetical protein